MAQQQNDALTFRRPRFIPFEGDAPLGPLAEANLLEKLAFAGYRERAGESAPKAAAQRMQEELTIIGDGGLAFLLLEAAQAVRLLRENGFVTGPGRGSVGCSLVAWALGIVHLNPMTLGLPFERFLSAEAVKAGAVPDIDIDMPPEARTLVRADLEARYGKTRVYGISQAIIYGQRSALQDAAMMLHGDTKASVRLRKEVREVKDGPLVWPAAVNQEEEEVLALAQKLCGTPKLDEKTNTPILNPHPAGTVVLPEPPAPGERAWPRVKVVGPPHNPQRAQVDWHGLHLPPRLLPRLSYTKAEAESRGLLVLDHLGSKHTEFLLAMSREIWGETRDGRLGFEGVDLDDPTIISATIHRNGPHGIFQMGGDAMFRAIAALRPRNFNDIVLLSAAVRPGAPLDELVERRNGKKPSTFIHHNLAEETQETSGLLIYQEQVMALLMKLAFFGPGDAAQVVKLLSKKKPEELAKWKDRFLVGCKKGGLGYEARGYWKLVEDAASYMFNRAHAGNYSVVTAWELWAKWNHTTIFRTCYRKVFGKQAANTLAEKMGGRWEELENRLTPEKLQGSFF